MIDKIYDLKNKYISMPIQIKASFWFLICTFAQKGISFITTPIFTRLMNATEYGEYGVFLSWQGIFSVFVSLNLSAGVFTRGLVKYEEERSKFVASFQGLCLTLTVVWTVVYFLFYEFWNQITGLSTKHMVLMIISIWLSSVFHFWAAEQRVDYQYKNLVAITLVVSVLGPTLGIVLIAYTNDAVVARILGVIIIELIAYVGLFISHLRKGKVFFDYKFWKYGLTFNIPLIPHYLSMTILNSADRIMIDKMVGGREVGIYNLAYQISMVMTMFNTALMHTVEPWLYKKIKAKQIQDISKIAYSLFVVIAGLNILLIAFAPEIISIFAPVEYAEAIWVVPPVAMGAFFMFLYTFFAVFEFYYSKTKFISIATMVGAAFNVILNYILIDIFGYIAAGYTTLFCYIIYALCHYMCMKKICNEYHEGQNPYDEKILLLISIVFIGIGVVLLSTYDMKVMRYVLIGLAFVLILFNCKKIIVFTKKLITINR